MFCLQAAVTKAGGDRKSCEANRDRLGQNSISSYCHPAWEQRQFPLPLFRKQPSSLNTPSSSPCSRPAWRGLCDPGNWGRGSQPARGQWLLCAAGSTSHYSCLAPTCVGQADFITPLSFSRGISTKAGASCSGSDQYPRRCSLASRRSWPALSA